jgi:hypothetical protein
MDPYQLLQLILPAVHNIPIYTTTGILIPVIVINGDVVDGDQNQLLELIAAMS